MPIEQWHPEGTRDGKTLRGTLGHRSPNQNKVHLLSVYNWHTQVVLAQIQIGDKENEITRMQEVLANLPLAGKQLSAAALHSQREFCRFSRNQQAHYLLIAKGKQPSLQADIAQLFNFEGAWPAARPQLTATTTEVATKGWE